MIRLIPIIILFFLFVQTTDAQQPALQSKWKFHSLNQVGLLQGDSKGAFHLQSVNGFEKSTWFAGIGTGLDYYRYRSIPLFAEVIKYLGKPGNQFFIFGDAGVHFVWEKADNTSYSTEKYYPGFYGGGGIGYSASFKNGMGFLLSAGYSYKRVLRQEKHETSFCPFNGPCYIQTNDYRYDLNRLLIQIGLMF